MNPRVAFASPLARRCAALMLACLMSTLAACGDSATAGSAGVAGGVGVAPGAPAQLPFMLSGDAAALPEQFIVTHLEKVSEKRVDRTVFEYGFRVSIKNTGPSDVVGVTALVTKASPGTKVLSGLASAPLIAAGATVTSTDLIVVRLDRTRPFDPSQLAWQILDAASLRLNHLKPAETYTFSLAKLNIPASAESVAASGAVSTALLKDGTLRFATPGDTGSDQYAQFVVKAGGASILLHARIPSARPGKIISGGDTDGDPAPQSPVLTLSGFGPNNSLTGGTLKFKLAGVTGIKLAAHSDVAMVGPDKVSISLKQYWTYDAADSSFSIAGASLQQLLSKLPAGSLSVAASFVSDDAEFVASYEFLAINPRTTLKGQFVTAGGANATVLAGKTVLLKGFNANVRKTALVDANGAFQFSGVIPDTYYVTLNDLEHPNLVAGSTSVYPDSTQVSMTIVYAAPGAAPLMPGVVPVKGSSKQNGTAPPQRDQPADGASVAGKAQGGLLAAADGAVFSAKSATQNVVSETPIKVVVPVGTQSVKVIATVQTDEYPVWTTKQSIYNDTWSYEVGGLPEPIGAADSVNHSHFTQGTVTNTTCVDVSKQTKDQPLTLTGSVKATNIGDSILPTTTTVTISFSCAELKVTAATFFTTNANGAIVLQPVNIGVHSNLAGPYLSVPLSAGGTAHTLPLEIEFFPADAKITEVNMSVSQGAEPAFASENLLSQSNTATPGKISLPRLVLPSFPGAKGGGKVTVLVRLKGKVNGVDATSNPKEGGQVGLDNEPSVFMPLFRAGAETDLAGRRFSQPEDAGGDSWSTFQAIAWIKSKAYRFNDVSGQHIAQDSSGRSLLGHKGHSDGQQFDLRYADGQGGFSESLGGANNGADILLLINAAKAEVVAHAAQKPNLLRLQAWITANRNMMDGEAAVAGTRVIYIGQSFITLALISGQFSAAADDKIPGITAWQHSSKVTPYEGHLNHWHISTTEHP